MEQNLTSYPVIRVDALVPRDLAKILARWSLGPDALQGVGCVLYPVWVLRYETSLRVPFRARPLTWNSFATVDAAGGGVALCDGFPDAEEISFPRSDVVPALLDQDAAARAGGEDLITRKALFQYRPWLYAPRSRVAEARCLYKRVWVLRLTGRPGHRERLVFVDSVTGSVEEREIPDVPS